MNIINFPNLEKYSIQTVMRTPSNQNIYIGYDKTSKANKIILIYNMQQINYLEILNFFDAYRINKATNHKKLIHLLNIGKTYQGLTGYMYLIVDYDFYRLESLENAFNNHTMTIENSIQIICQALDGINHAHKYNIIHRNITTDYILNKGNETKLFNYHLLFTPGYFSKDEELTLLSYKAPEFFCYKNLCNYLTDIYSLGIVLFRCVNQFDNWLEVMKQVNDLERQVKTSNLVNYIGYKSHVTNDIKAIINKACGHTLDNHYSSVLELKQDLMNLFDIKN